jgi:hypothetical protein
LAAQQNLAPSSDKALKLFAELEKKPLPAAPETTEAAKPRASVLQPSAPAVATPPSAAAAAPAAASSASRPTLAAEAKADGPSPLVIVGALGVIGAGAAIASNNNGGAEAAAAAAPPAAAAAPPAEPTPASSDSSSTGAQ